MTMRTGLIITGDSKAGQKAVEEMAASVAKLGAGAKGAAAPAKQLETAVTGVAQAAAKASETTGRLDTAQIDGARAAEQAAIAQGHVAKAAADAASASTAAAEAARANMAATAEMVRSTQALTTALQAQADAQDRATAFAREIAETRQLAEEQRKAAAAAREEANALDVFRNMLDPTAIATERLNQQLEVAARLHQQGKLSEEEHARVTQLLSQATNEGTRNLGLQRAGLQNAGYQVQDFLVQVNGGTSAIKAFSMQGPQLIGSLQMIAQSAEGTTGKMGSLLNILAGGWGVALGVAIPLISMLIESMGETGSATDKASAATVDFSSTLVANQGAVTGYTAAIDQLAEATRGLINTQALLIDNSRTVAQATVASLSTELSALDKKIADTRARAESGGGLFGVILGEGGQIASAQLAQLQRQRSTIQQALDSAKGSYASAQTAFEARSATEAADPKAGALAKIARERAQLEERRRYTVQLGDGVPLAGGGLQTISGSDFEKEMGRLKTREIAIGEADKKSRAAEAAAKRAAKEQERLVNFGEKTDDVIARLSSQYDSAPKDIDQAAAATRKLDDVIADLQKRRPPDFQHLIDQANAIRPLIEESLAKPFRDMLEAQQRDIDVGKLRVSGRQAEAEALQLTHNLMDKLGVSSEEQLAVALAKRGVTGDEVRQLYDNLAVMREQTRELRRQEQIQQSWLGAIQSGRQGVNQMLRDLRTEGPKAFGDFFKRSMSIADQLFADVATEKLFGGLFRDLEDQVTGANRVTKAGADFGDAVDSAATALKSIEPAAKSAAAALGKNGGNTVEGAAANAGTAAPEASAAQDIVVNGVRKAFKSGYESLFTDVNKGFGHILDGIFGSNGGFSRQLAEGLGKAFAGAQFGSSISSAIFGAGGKGSQFGSFIGGAIGEKVGEKVLTKGLDKVLSGLGEFAGPLGSIVGAIGGSLLGGLFKGKPMLGSSVLTSVDQSDPGIWGRLGGLENVAAVDKGVQDSLKQIIAALGGTAGAFSVGIGNVEYNGQSIYRVSGDGRYDVGTQDYYKNGGTTIYDGTDASEALKAAVANAIADGAVQGISAAMKKALASSSDVDAAVKQALKVREIEDAIAGMGDGMSKAFSDLASQAAERLRIATTFGIDIVAVEKKNAEDRAALIKQYAEEQVGGLQRLVDELTSGSLFEGSAVDQRTAILGEIEKAKADVGAGVKGAGDTLANLYEQLNSVSKEAFGETGQYAADRSMILDQARAAIAAANARIEAASSSTSDPALTQTNQALDENNDQNATLIALVRDLPGGIASAIAAIKSNSAIDVAALAKTS